MCGLYLLEEHGARWCSGPIVHVCHSTPADTGMFTYICRFNSYTWQEALRSDTFTFYHTNYPIIPTTNPLAPCLKFTPLYLISPSFIWLTATRSHDMPIKFHHHHRNPLVNAVNAGWFPVPGWVPDSGREGQTLACESL